ncbi:fimbrial protein FimV [Stenotrophomonas sp. Betaine-02u-21]|uniref:type IV pilus assembly protein FimV n=1 Tax=unclassified Stenotrophomonas TaxID=196198 RepID=UPI000C33B5F2|nr:MULTISPECIES: FimV/HubP family polar landmark protein [unclassified Stenotrophomonas]PKH71157.1 fimbrial protein FimV [Stenotrophomonas sp. Betaine-02u-21]PKH76366.1 fimbrial protein FimV [Stenotrophomonas sp. Betaine-02u-23]PKH94881.1 fimbrial protein FimV [Stenotrophomonas sp. Bg11-02]
MNNGARGVMRPLKYLSTLLLALASSSAMALGLGDIRVLSRPGQPLVAEIPIISADPSELQNLRVGLASPVTFERVGLQRPTGLVSELQFELTRTAQGRAVVRVTSASPVETPALAFLIEADWGQGRLVREYSALMDAPTSAVALSEPEIEAPAGAMSNAIIREPQAVPAQLPPETSTAGAAPAPAPAARTANTASPRAPVPEATGAAGDIAVRQGQTLSQIAQSLAVGQQISRERAMIALLRANPEAFIRGNINLLKQGAVLRVPDAASLAAVDGSEAAAMVREHAAQWRQSRTLPQPAAADSSVAAATPAPAAAAARSSGARLEIAPAVAAAAATAGSTTGTGDGNEGDMLGNEQLRQAREDVATRDAEIDELKQRVADLEKLKAQQQALVSLKDTEIAAAQARLAETPQQASSGPWFWLALPLLLLVAVGWWLSRRRKPSPLPPLRRDDHDDSALSAAVPAGAGLDVLAERAGWEQDPREQADADTDTGTGIAGQAPVHFDLETPVSVSTAAPAATEPFLEPEPVVDPVPAYARHAEQQDAFRGVFELPAGDAPAAPEISDDAAAHAPDAAAATPAHAGGHDRLELAIAYLDLGDAQTARSLLEEVARSDDPHLQAQARELLARLG